MYMYKWAVTAVFVGVLAACSSPVKLNDVSVEDKSAQASTPMKMLTPATVAPAGEKKSAVTNLDKTASSASGATSADTLPASSGRTIYFEFDSFAIRPEFEAVIEANARSLKANKNQRIAIEGHTDERGGREYNIALGQKRADAVRKALSLQGVAEAQMESVSFGKEKPAMTGDGEMAMEKNRRAEIVIR